MEKTTETSRKSANIQLAFLGFVALSIGIICMVCTVFVYGYDPITSISESATTGNATGMILPFALGCMFTYTISYNGYCRSERIITRIMGVCFWIVAMQLCNSIYVTESRVGMFGLPAAASNIVHLCAAAGGFGLMFVWVAFYFTRSDKDKQHRTKQKIIRNYIYLACGAAMFCGLLMLIIGSIVPMGRYIVFIGEQFILIPASIAIIIKSGLILKDK